MKAIVVLFVGAVFTWSGLWFTPDQRGQRLLEQGSYREAAAAFDDPMRAGVAWFRAGEFERAERAFARVASAEAEFNRGNCLVMRGKYESAIERYDRALELRRDWEDATINRRIAQIRADRVRQEGGEMGDQKVGADEIVFDKTKEGGDQDTEAGEQQTVSDSAMQEMWLRRVQTKPAGFLKSKFAYQLAEDVP